MMTHCPGLVPLLVVGGFAAMGAALLIGAVWVQKLVLGIT